MFRPLLSRETDLKLQDILMAYDAFFSQQLYRNQNLPILILQWYFTGIH